MENLDELREELLFKASSAESLETLEELRVAVLGRNGQLTKLMKGLGGLNPDERRAADERRPPRLGQLCPPQRQPPPPGHAQQRHAAEAGNVLDPLAALRGDGALNVLHLCICLLRRTRHGTGRGESPRPIFRHALAD